MWWSTGRGELPSTCRLYEGFIPVTLRAQTRSIKVTPPCIETRKEKKAVSSMYKCITTGYFWNIVA